jgi:hypothetical protein
MRAASSACGSIVRQHVEERVPLRDVDEVAQRRVFAAATRLTVRRGAAAVSSSMPSKDTRARVAAHDLEGRCRALAVLGRLRYCGEEAVELLRVSAAIWSCGTVGDESPRRGSVSTMFRTAG